MKKARVRAASAPMKEAQAAKAVDRAYEYISDQAISFGFHPGERINEVELAAVLGMSRAPVREALNRLVVAGLAAFEPGRGFFCRKLSASEVGELLEVRGDMELAAVKQACSVASDADIKTVLDDWKEVAAGNPSSIDEMVVVDEQIHQQTAALAGNAERLRFLQNINERIRFIRRIRLEGSAGSPSFIGEHLNILQAIADRDAGKAVTLMQRHLNTNSDDLKSSIHEGIARIYADKIV